MNTYHIQSIEFKVIGIQNQTLYKVIMIYVQSYPIEIFFSLQQIFKNVVLICFLKT